MKKLIIYIKILIDWFTPEPKQKTIYELCEEECRYIENNIRRCRRLEHTGEIAKSIQDFNILFTNMENIKFNTDFLNEMLEHKINELSK
jgi:hypothetical protein